ncbi:MAG: hypothetical protein AB7O37_01285 [Vicinamibacteria bacterium]
MNQGAGSRAHRGASLLRIAAFLLLAVIAADVVGDASCDLPGARSGAATALRPAGADGTPEACVSFCVPDCFCCSRSVAAAAAITPPRPAPLAALDAPVAERWPHGVRPAVDHPPLPRG